MANNSKAILVTGSSSGFGRDFVETLAAAGHHVVATMRGVDGKNAAVAAELTALQVSGRVTVVDIDVTDDDSVTAGVAAALEATGGRLDVLINNAGAGFGTGFVEGNSVNLMTRQFDLNVIGVHRVTKACLPTMRHQRQGLVINISSIGGRLPFPFVGIYVATKHALEAYTTALAVELSQYGVDVCAVQPGGYGTNFGANLVWNDDEDAVSGYADFQPQPKEWFKLAFEQMAKTTDASPHDVVAAVHEHVVDVDAGQRPWRLLVDPGPGAAVADINKVVDEATIQMFTQYGVGDLLPSGAHSRAVIARELLPLQQ